MKSQREQIGFEEKVTEKQILKNESICVPGTQKVRAGGVFWVEAVAQRWQYSCVFLNHIRTTGLSTWCMEYIGRWGRQGIGKVKTRTCRGGCWVPQVGYTERDRTCMCKHYALNKEEELAHIGDQMGGFWTEYLVGVLLHLGNLELDETELPNWGGGEGYISYKPGTDFRPL